MGDATGRLDKVYHLPPSHIATYLSSESFHWCRTALSLDRLAASVRKIHSDAVVRMVCGGDLLESFSVIKENGEPLWLEEDKGIILERNGVTCIEREGTDLKEVIDREPALKANEERITVVKMKVVLLLFNLCA